MKINLGISGWPSAELTLEDAIDLAIDCKPEHVGGELEDMRARITHLEAIIKLILTPEQVLTLVREFMQPNAFLCDLDKEQ